MIAYLCGIALPFPGFVGTLGAHVSTSATDLGRLGWLLSFTVSFVVYYAICFFWPTRNQVLIKEMGLGWEEESGDMVVAEDGTQIVEEGSKVHAVSEIPEIDGTVVSSESYGVHEKY